MTTHFIYMSFFPALLCFSFQDTDCPQPRPVDNCNILPREPEYFLKDQITYECHEGYFLEGPSYRMCSFGGSWTGSDPQCLKNVTQRGKGIRLKRGMHLNIFIALDVSSSIRNTDFDMAKQAVIALIEKIASFTVMPNYDVLLFSPSTITSVSDIMLPFGDYKKRLDDLVTALENVLIPRTNETGTDLQTVFKIIQLKIKLLALRQTNFGDHQNAIFVFTNGQLNIGGNPMDIVEDIKHTIYNNIYQQLEEHLDIYMFGIGNPMYAGNLQGITFGTGKHFFRLENLDNLQKTFEEILNEDDVQGLCGLYRDYGGDTRETKRWKHPWAMTVYVVTESGRTFKCGGSLVSSRFVLTAAHCLIEANNIMRVKVEPFLYKQLDVREYFVHPLFNIHAKSDQGVAEFLDYDVALLRLEKDVKISASLRPICLPCTEETNGALRQSLTCQQQEHLLITNRQEVKFLSNERGSFFEKHAHIELQNRQNCIRRALLAPGITTTDPTAAVTENFLCTGGNSLLSSNVDHLACRGDGGGAVFRNYLQRTIQVAVVSWGNNPAPVCRRSGLQQSDDGSRDFHLNLFKVLPFLKSILGKSNQDYAPIIFVD